MVTPSPFTANPSACRPSGNSAAELHRRSTPSGPRRRHSSISSVRPPDPDAAPSQVTRSCGAPSRAAPRRWGSGVPSCVIAASRATSPSRRRPYTRTEPRGAGSGSVNTPTVSAPVPPPAPRRCTRKPAPPQAAMKASSRSWMNAIDAKGSPAPRFSMISSSASENSAARAASMSAGAVSPVVARTPRSASTRDSRSVAPPSAAAPIAMSATSTAHAWRMGLSYNERAMVRLLDRYVWKELVPPFAIGVGVFTFFLIIDRIYQLTTLVITKNVPFQLVLSLLVFLLPAFLSLTLPMALLVAVLLVGGRLAGDFEVAALKAAGVSPLRLFRPFVVAALIVTVLIGWLTLVVVPWSIGAFQQQLFKILQSRAATGITERTFTSAFGHFVVYVDEVSPSQLALRGVVVSDERDPQRTRIVVAREGRLLTDEANRRITLRFLDGAINEAEVADPRRFRHTAFSLYDMTLPIASPLARGSKDDKPEKEMSLGRLAETARDLEEK